MYEAGVGIVINVQLERDQPETYPYSIRTLSGTILGFFVYNAYGDTVSQQCDCSSQSRRTTANLISVSSPIQGKLESLTTRTGKTEAVIVKLVQLSFTWPLAPLLCEFAGT